MASGKKICPVRESGRLVLKMSEISNNKVWAGRDFAAHCFLGARAVNFRSVTEIV
jgi:hypothetical protein